MTPLTGVDSAIYGALLGGGLSLLAWLVLWPVRTTAVHLWCVGTLLGSVFTVLLLGSDRSWHLPPVLLLPVLALLLAGGGLLKLLALSHLLLERQQRLVLIALLSGIGMAALAAALLLPDRVWFSIGLLATLTLLFGLSAWKALRLWRQLRLLHALLLAWTLGVSTAWISLTLLAALISPRDILRPADAPVPLLLVAVPLFIGICNAVLFIGVMLDLAARQLNESQRKIARLEERQRLVADLHDGFGSQLASARLRAERGQLSSEAMKDLLEQCVLDLYLVVDAVNNTEQSIGNALRFFRERVDARLVGPAPVVDWDLRVGGASPLPPETILQLMRIVQEALSNALRHARAGRVIVMAEYAEGVLRIAVTDDGIGLPPDAREGNGLRNLRSRARRIGAAILVEATRPGTRVQVELTVPTA